MFELSKISAGHIFEGLTSSLKDHVASDSVFVIDCEDNESGMFKE